MASSVAELLGPPEYKFVRRMFCHTSAILVRRPLPLSESERELTIHGDFALERSAYMVAVLPLSGGNRMRDDGRSFFIWKRQADGSWKIWQWMWNSIKPVGIGTNRYLSRMMQKKAKGKP